METVTLSIGGMPCGHCVSAVEDALLTLKGVKAVDVSLDKAQAVVQFDHTKVGTEQMAAAVRGAGYAVAQADPGEGPGTGARHRAHGGGCCG